MRRLLTLLLFVFAGAQVFATTAEERFSKGVEAFEAGDFQRAIDTWEALEQQGLESYELYYNLGDAYFKKGEFPSAILYFEKALKLKPFSKEAKNNLQLANERIIKRIKPLPDFFLKRAWQGLRDIFSSNTWSGLALILFWLGVGSIVARLLDWKRGKWQGSYVLGGGLVAVALLFLLVAFSRGRFEEDSQMAIVVKSGIELRTAPESTIDVMELPAGTKLQIVDKIGDWEKVEAPNGEVGWINVEDAVRI